MIEKIICENDEVYGLNTMSIQNCNRTKKQTFALLIVLLITLLLGSYYVDSYLYSNALGHDESYYLEMAKRIVDEGIYSYASETPNAFVPPGLPIYLSFCYCIFGFSADGLAAIRILQLFFSVATVYLVYVFGKRITNNQSVGILAAGLVGVNLDFYSYTIAFLTENIYFLSLMIFLVLYTYSKSSTKIWLHLFTGLTFGICVLIRSLIFIVFFTLYIPFFIQNINERRIAFKCFSFFVLGFILIMTPWWIRNYIAFGKLILFCKQDHIIYEGFANNFWELGYAAPNTAKEHFSILIDMLRNTPVKTFAWFTFGKFDVLFLEHNNSTFSTVATIAKDVIVFLGLPTCVSSLYKKSVRWETISFFSYFLAIFIGVVTPRYSLQYVLILSVPAAYVLIRLFSY